MSGNPVQDLDTARYNNSTLDGQFVLPDDLFTNWSFDFAQDDVFDWMGAQDFMAFPSVDGADTWPQQN